MRVIVLFLALLLLLMLFWQGTPVGAAKEKMPSRTVGIPLSPPVELDYLTRNEIFSLRRAAMKKHPSFIPASYEPSEGVFGGIVDRKPWWGMLGVYYYSFGEKCTEGPSEESRFIVNPYLLVGVRESCSYDLAKFGRKSLKPEDFSPRALALEWSSDGTEGKVTYDVSRFWKKFDDLLKKEHIRFQNEDIKELYLIAYNARDLGFPFLYVDASRCRNVIIPDNRLVGIPQYIHLAYNCGNPEGVNNMSPYCSQLIVRLKDLPAYVETRLWRSAPRQVNEKADVTFGIMMK
ncbi:MAG: hypothetical protein RDV48_08015 [Candidatus Eremiobacteraeota bacterium]|nr:hypothetical protein [Candidatus Eremiobacteraeota bacterium]